MFTRSYIPFSCFCGNACYADYNLDFYSYTGQLIASASLSRPVYQDLITNIFIDK